MRLRRHQAPEPGLEVLGRTAGCITSTSLLIQGSTPEACVPLFALGFFVEQAGRAVGHARWLKDFRGLWSLPPL